MIYNVIGCDGSGKTTYCMSKDRFITDEGYTNMSLDMFSFYHHCVRKAHFCEADEFFVRMPIATIHDVYMTNFFVNCLYKGDYPSNTGVMWDDGWTLLLFERDPNKIICDRDITLEEIERQQTWYREFYDNSNILKEIIHVDF
jgi:hypothetical protein